MSDDSENDSEMDFDDYYGETDDVEPGICDPEYFAYSCLSAEQVEQMLNEQIEALTNSVKVTPSLAKVLLHTHDWDVEKVKLLYLSDSNKLLIESQIRVAPQLRVGSYTARHSYASVCAVCFVATSSDYLRSLACGHLFCKECWIMHFEVQITQGVTTGIECMSPDCRILATEDFVLSVLTRPVLREKYLQFSFFDYVKSHPELRFCPGPNCSVIVRAVKDPKAKRVICTSCKSSFCFRCGSDYHAPADCDTIRKWLSKCEDDSETANYISAHTKDCPKCHICIEKNGGCNHMQCYSCKHDFCWMCLGDWKTHGSEYYECSRYKENPNIASESAHAQAREALKKYLHYYERWENHAKSLRLEEATVQKIRDRINCKVMTKDGTWIDWQCLLDAAALLARCRYTLQYTYPFAYFLEAGPRKELFEYQQAQLEREIENLSWQIEHAETCSRSGLENQMDIAEKCRTTLLKDFLDV